LRAKELGGFSSRHLTIWHGARKVNSLKKIARIINLPELNDNIHIIPLFAGHPETDLSIAGDFSILIEFQNKILVVIVSLLI
jgi:hypothetical protein